MTGNVATDDYNTITATITTIKLQDTILPPNKQLEQHTTHSKRIKAFKQVLFYGVFFVTLAKKRALKKKERDRGYSDI